MNKYINKHLHIPVEAKIQKRGFFQILPLSVYNVSLVFNTCSKPTVIIGHNEQSISQFLACSIFISIFILINLHFSASWKVFIH